MLIEFIKKNKWPFFGAMIFGLLAGFSASFLLITVHKGLDQLSTGLQLNHILQFGAASIGYVIFYILSDTTLAKLAQQSITNFQLILSEKIIHARLTAIEEKQPSKLLDILQHDLHIIGRIIETSPKAFVDFFIFIGCLGYIAYLSLYVFIILLSASGVILALYYFLNQHIRNQSTTIRDTLSALYANFHALLFGIKELQLSTPKRDYFYTHLIQHNATTYRDETIKLNITLSLFKRFIEVMLYIIVGFLIFGLPYFLPSLTTSTLTGFVLATLFLIKPIESLLGFVAVSAQFSASMEKVTQLQQQLTINHPTTSVQKLSSTVTELQLTDITYTYYNMEIDDSFTLGPISTTINTGEITYIIGGNGSGKTTLGKLLCGLYFPKNGQFTLNNTPISNDTMVWYRDHFSVVFSDFYLFDHFLELNDLPQDKVQHYIDAFHLTQKVTYQDGKFSTLKLSTGQRKRLALIIACLQDRPIYIFDEWASDQDPEFKKVFYNEILPDLKQKNKMVIVITHDDFYFDKADRIIRLRSGKLVED